jgi:predicted deacylase
MTVELPSIQLVRANEPGPTVALLGGIHGDEYEGVIAARALSRMLPDILKRGSVRIAAPAHPAAWSACSRLSPHDGENLARVFPGRADGSATEAIAHLLTNEVLRGADLLIDLHSAGSAFIMPFLCGYNDDDGALGAASERFALAFGADFVWRHAGPIAPGRSLSAAADLGIPSIYVEGTGGLSIQAREIDGYLTGVQRVLSVLGMLPPMEAAVPESIRVSGDGNTDTGIVTAADGYLSVHVQVGDSIDVGDTIGTILDLDGGNIASVVSPLSGCVMMLRRNARVTPGDTVAIVAERVVG